jgi:hypothetical protein
MFAQRFRQEEHQQQQRENVSEPISLFFKRMLMGATIDENPQSFAQNEIREEISSNRLATNFIPLRNYGFVFVMFTIILGLTQIPNSFLNALFFPAAFNLYESTLLDFILVCLSCCWIGAITTVSFLEVFTKEHAKVKKCLFFSRHIFDILFYSS